MLPDSIGFVYFFLPFLLFANYITPSKYRRAVLAVSGIVFLALLQPNMLPVTLIYCLCDYVFGYVLDQVDAKWFRRAIVVASVTFNAAVFLLVQYSNLLPYIIGTSIIGLIKISYVVGIYQRRIRSTTSLVLYLSNVLCFPCIIAGPIHDYADMEYRQQNIQLNLTYFGAGARLFVYGLFKKAVIADTLSYLLELLQNSDGASTVLGAWMSWFCSVSVLYYIMCGYAQMAQGICRMLGFEVKSNFQYPFGASSVNEFFRRFNVTLGEFMRRYVYIPLGGNRKGAFCMLTAIFAVSLLNVVWYRFSLNTVLASLYFAVLLVIQKLYELKRAPASQKQINPIVRVLQSIGTWILLIPGWTLFMSNTPQEAWNWLGMMLGISGVPLYNDRAIYYLLSYSGYLIAAAALLFSWFRSLYRNMTHKRKPVSNILVLLAHIAMLVVSSIYLMS